MIQTAIKGNVALVTSLLTHLAWPHHTLTLLPPKLGGIQHTAVTLHSIWVDHE